MNKYLAFIIILTNYLTADDFKELPKRLDITILIHGSLRPRGKISDIVAVKNDKNVEKTDYAKSNNYLRNHSFTKQSQPMQDIGLHKIDHASPESSKLTAAIISELDNTKNELMYTFGWSGLLTRSGRKADGLKLYNEIASEIKKLKKQNIEPKIRIIAFSHGGNVALNMAKAINENNNFKKDFLINELILIGTPVQRDTDYLINSDLFSGIYHFYSTNDLAQKIDHISATSHYCHQRFAARKGFCLPKKLKQIRIRLRKALSPRPAFTEKHYQCVSPQKAYSYNDPGHIEMWFFGWCAKGYRKNYPLFPLPVSVFTPWLVRIINKLPSTAPHITADIYPQAGTLNLFLGTFCKSNEEYSLPFISCNNLKSIKKWSLDKKPNQNTNEIYKQVVHEALLLGKLKKRCRG